MPDDDENDADSAALEHPRRRSLKERFADVEVAPVVAAPDGGLAPMPLPPEDPVPVMTPANSPCLRGPCRYYWEMQSRFPLGNPAGTFGGPNGLRDPLTGELVREPRQINRTCMVQPGIETDLNDDIVYDCNQWDPVPVGLLPSTRAGRRSRYLKIHRDALHPTTKED